MLAKRILNVWKNYLAGQMLSTVFVSIASWLAGTLTGIRVPIINAIIAGICENIPNIGPIFSGTISAVLALVFGSSRLQIANWQFMLITIAATILIQLLQNWLIGPLIIGKKMDLNPILVIVSMTVFSVLFGFWGMILAVPVIGTLREIYRFCKGGPEARIDRPESEPADDDDRLEPVP